MFYLPCPRHSRPTGLTERSRSAFICGATIASVAVDTSFVAFWGGERVLILYSAPEPGIRERVRHGDRAFLIEIFPRDEGFRGEWTCPTCVQGGSSAAIYASSDAARAWARLATNVHYLAVHAE
jgi:hypothetical protein